MTFNKNRTIRLYLLSIFLIVSGVFAVFLAANLFASKNTASKIEQMRNREFPLVQQLLLAQRDVEQLKELFEDAVAFESDFLIMEAQEHADSIKARLEHVDALYDGGREDVVVLKSLLEQYTHLGAALAKKMVMNPSDPAQFNESAVIANGVYKTLRHAVANEVEQQQRRYAEHLATINEDFNVSNRLAAFVGVALLMVLFIFTRTMAKKIMATIKRTDEIKGAFMTTISHELRTPLNGIKGAIELIEGVSSNGEDRELMDVAKTSVTKMEHVVDDIILFTELSSGIQVNSKSPFNLKSAIQDILDYAYAQSAKKGIAFELNMAMPQGEIVCDEGKVVKIVWQLLSNAVQFTEFGVVRLSIELKRERLGGEEHCLAITITDDGPGIDEHYKASLFQPFEQGEKGWNRAFQGLGLGLTMSLKLVKCLGGTLSINNRPDTHGVIAAVMIPCAFIESESESAAADASLLPTSSVLVVEDNRANQIVIQKLLEKLDLPSELASNGEEALALIKAHPDFSMILMDCQMPVMDGFEATKAIRELEGKIKDVPIVAVTANTRSEDREACLKAGMDDFLEKPIKLGSVQGTISKHLNRDVKK